MTRAVKILVTMVGLAGLLVPGEARGEGHPELAAYSADTDRMFWFLHVTDLHVGAGETAIENLDLLIREGDLAFRPWFYIVTGDLVEDGSHEEWILYRDMVEDLGDEEDRWWDIPGNHDNNFFADDFEPGYLDFFLEYSISGAVHNAWVLDTSFGKYQMVGVYTDCDAQARISRVELDNVLASLELAPDARLVFVAGHHPLTGTEAVKGGAGGLQALMTEFGASLYLHGHIHTTLEFWWPNSFTPYGYLTWLSPVIGKPVQVLGPAGFTVMAVDNDSLAARSLLFEPGPSLPSPVVLITAPADWSLGGSNPYAYPVSTSSRVNPVRALVFSNSPVEKVRFNIDRGPWRAMTHAGDLLWTGEFNGSLLALDRDIWLEVKAWTLDGRSNTHRIHVRAVERGACEDGVDNDGDGLTDYLDDPGCTGDFDSDEREPWLLGKADYAGPPGAGNGDLVGCGCGTGGGSAVGLLLVLLGLAAILSRRTG